MKTPASLSARADSLASAVGAEKFRALIESLRTKIVLSDDEQDTADLIRQISGTKAIAADGDSTAQDSASPSRAASAARNATVAVALVGLLSVGGCETISAGIANGTQAIGNAVGLHDAKTAGAVFGAVGGCALGSAVALVAHVGVGKGCAGGAVVGGLAGYWAARHEQLKAAQALAAETAGTQAKVTVATTTVAAAPAAASGAIATASAGKSEEQLKTLKLAMPDASVDARNPDIASAAQKVGQIAAMSPDGATIQVSGTKARRDWLQAQALQGVPADAASKVRFVSVASSQTGMTMTPAAQAQA